MRRRHVITLGTAAAVVLGAAVLLAPDTPERGTLPSPAGGGLAFEGLAARLQGAARIEARKHDGSLTLLRQGDSWVLPDRGGYPARPERVRELLVGLTELRLVEPRTADPAQLDRLGLDDPMRPGSTAVLLRVLDGAGAPLAELVIGRRRVRTAGNVPESAYVRRPGETQAWLAEGRLPVDADPQLWVDRDIANLPQDRVQRVTVRRRGEPELVLARGDEPEAKLRVVAPADAPPADDVALDEIARGFEFLTFLEVKPEAEIPGTPLGESRFELTEGLAITVQPSKDEDRLWIRLRAEGDGPGGEAAAERLNARWRGWAYQVGVWKEKAYIPRAEDLAPPPPAGSGAPPR